MSQSVGYQENLFSRKSGETLEQAVDRGCGFTDAGDVQETCGCTEGHGQRVWW